MTDIDPVCGMPVREGTWALEYEQRRICFCSSYCREQFLRDPTRYFGGEVSAAVALRASPRVAYFSMEVAFPDNLPLYSGGLGVLAGDMLRSCADLGIPVVGVSLLYRQGYFDQGLDVYGWQHESSVRWQPQEHLQPLEATVRIEIGGRQVLVRAWRYTIEGAGHDVPVILLDTDVEGNSAEDRALVQRLYGGGPEHRLAQEILLGIGGLRMLAALGYSSIAKYHMNEGHSSLLVLELLRSEPGLSEQPLPFANVRSKCVFTTHTPVAVGHDQFEYDLAYRMLPREIPRELVRMLAGPDRLNMTMLGINLSQFVNGVARRHEEVARLMFPDHAVHHITNGVHHGAWTAPALQAVFDAHLPGWRDDPATLRQAMELPEKALWDAHITCKSALIELVRERTGAVLDPDAMTIGFARRATTYKRSDLVFVDLDRLRRISREAGPLQLVFAGKAHPNDEPGKRLIQRLLSAASRLRGDVCVVFLPNYDVAMARVLVAGADVWLNTPERPLEASGTSGMKAALNGVPSFSTLDGWWLEGHIEGVTGWSIGARDANADSAAASSADAEDLYLKLARDILPLFHGKRPQWISVMRQCIALNGSYFNTHRMVHQYASAAYLP